MWNRDEGIMEDLYHHSTFTSRIGESESKIEMKHARPIYFWD